MRIQNSKFKIQNSNDGFTLIEMLVAVAVFGTMAAIAAGVLLNVSDAQRKVLALRVAQDNLSYALDVIGKEIRTGSFYHCGADISLVPQDCPSGGSSFTFLNASGQTVAYRLSAQRLEVSKNGGASWQYLTSSDLIIIDELSFYTIGAAVGDGIQPRVTIILRGLAGIKEKTKARFNIQTTVSQRMLDS